MNHDQWLELADVYAAGALDGRELAEFEAHLATDCAQCAARIRATREALALMARSLPEVPPPPALRARVLAAVASEPARATRPLARPVAAPAPSPSAHRPSRALWWAGWSGLAAAAALLLFVNAELRSTRQELRALQDRLATLQIELTERESALRFLSDPNVRYVSLGGLKPTPDASAWLLWNPGTRQGLLLARGLPAPPAGQAYELWALAGAQPVPAGVFSVDAAGRALLRLPPLPEGHTYDAFAVTLEPAAGVPKPTGPMHLHGKVL
jgi:anti-sigma-K factor RskA